VSEFIVCPSCGTRIKEGREFCLRCLEPLPTEAGSVRLPIWVSLGLSEQNKLLVAVGVGVIVAALIAVIVFTDPPRVDETASQAGQPIASRPAAPPTQAPRSDVPAAADPSTAAPAAAASQPTEGDVDPKLAERRAVYEAQLAKVPTDAATLNSLGLLLQQMGQTEDAFHRLEAAVAAQPRKTEFRMNLATLANDLGRWDRAVEEYREATRLSPRHYLAQYSLAAALQKKGDDQTAVVEFEKARKLGPDNPAVPLGLGRSLEKLGRTADAVREYQQYLQIQPNSAESATVRSHLAALSGARPQVQ
jgi:tetratricopeptide (TPR) repeat protein